MGKHCQRGIACVRRGACLPLPLLHRKFRDRLIWVAAAVSIQPASSPSPASVLDAYEAFDKRRPGVAPAGCHPV
jgi:hypothetical protein